MLLRRAKVGSKNKYFKKNLKLIDAQVMVTLHQYSMLQFSKIPDNILSDMALKPSVYAHRTN